VPNYDSDFFLWVEHSAQEIVVKLAELKGSTDGHQFADESRSHVKARFLDTLDSLQAMARQLRTTARNWRRLNVEERKLELELINNLFVEQVEKEAAKIASIKQVLLDNKQKMESDEFLAATTKQDFRDLYKKIALYGAGFLIAVSLLGFLLSRFVEAE